MINYEEIERKPLVPAKEVAQYFGKSDRTIRVWRENGYLPKPMYVGRNIFYPSIAEIKNHIKKNNHE